jgi:hypothetical protein
MMLSIKSLGYYDSLFGYKNDFEQRFRRYAFSDNQGLKIVVDRLISLITTQCSFTNSSNLLYTICHPSEEPNTPTQQR